MAKKEPKTAQEAVQDKQSKKASKGKHGSIDLNKSKAEFDNLKKATKPAKKAAPKPAKAAAGKGKKAEPKAEPKRKNTKHVDIPNATVLKVLDGGKPLSKREIVVACGGDDVAVTKTIQRLRGLGQIVATGKSRSVMYSKSA